MIAPIQEEWKKPENKTWYGAKVKHSTLMLKCPKCGFEKIHPMDPSNIILCYATARMISMSTCPECGSDMNSYTKESITYYDQNGNTLEKEPSFIKQKNISILSKIADFFYEEEPAKKHLEEDENGNMIEVEDAPKRSINWFKVGACTTSVTLMTIGAIIMLIKKHH